MKKHYLLLAILFFSFQVVWSQSVGINDDNSSPEPSAMLDVKSNTKGMLVPRLTTSQRLLVSSPAKGLLVFDSDEACYYFYNGMAWENLSSGTWESTGNQVFVSNTAFRVGVGTTDPNGKMIVQGDNSLSTTLPLFEVRRPDGLPVFQVYSDGVRIYTEKGSKSANSGVKISDRNNQKGLHDYYFANSDSTRICFTKTAKGTGSVEIGDRDNQKAPTRLFRVTPDSTRVYINGGDKQGFGVVDKQNAKKLVDLTQKNYLIGHGTGEKMTTGNNNLLLGYFAGNSNTSRLRKKFCNYLNIN